MEQIKNLLGEYTKSGGELYYTEKQNRVLKAVVENPTASRSTIADEAGCHQSYVNYVLERASPNVIQAMIEEIEEGMSEESEQTLEETAPNLLEAFGQSDEGAGATSAAFGVGNDTEENESPLEVFRSGESHIQNIQQNEDGSTDITMIRQVPVEVTVSVPTEIFDSEVANMFGEGGLAAMAKEVNTEELLEA